MDHSASSAAIATTLGVSEGEGGRKVERESPRDTRQLTARAGSAEKGRIPGEAVQDAQERS